MVSLHSKEPRSPPSMTLPPTRMTPGFRARRASTTSLRQPPELSAGMSDALSSHRSPEPLKVIEIEAFESVSFGVRIADTFCQLPMVGREAEAYVVVPWNRSTRIAPFEEPRVHIENRQATPFFNERPS